MIQLGSYVRDKITGIEGYAMGRTEYLTGCAHVGIQRPGLSKDDKTFEWEWVDETRVDLVKSKKPLRLNAPAQQRSDRAGGPAPNAPQL